jgi:hypothetical protein
MTSDCGGQKEQGLSQQNHANHNQQASHDCEKRNGRFRVIGRKNINFFHNRGERARQDLPARPII